ncbi:MAG: hypothetical protein OEV37_00535 [Candidatus Berkelbacteria bacterium]|nr:hypothetical protein [Candidatus Berkelbacteria bacterium]
MNKTAIALFLATVATAVGLIGYNYAKADNAETTQPKSAIEGAVDDGIINQETADKLQNYIQETRQQRMKEMMEEKLKTVVENGTITEDEANQVRDWHNSRPAAMDKIGGRGFGRFGRGMSNCLNQTTENTNAS